LFQQIKRDWEHRSSSLDEPWLQAVLKMYQSFETFLSTPVWSQYDIDTQVKYVIKAMLSSRNAVWGGRQISDEDLNRLWLTELADENFITSHGMIATPSSHGQPN
jgi:hypothetical protein